MKKIYQEPGLVLVQVCREDILNGSNDPADEEVDMQDPSIELPKIEL